MVMGDGHGKQMLVLVLVVLVPVAVMVMWRFVLSESRVPSLISSHSQVHPHPFVPESAGRRLRCNTRPDFLVLSGFFIPTQEQVASKKKTVQVPRSQPRSPNSALLYPFSGEGSPTKMTTQKKLVPVF